MPLPPAFSGQGLGKSGPKRHRKIMRDNIYAITRGDIRRLARRGGIKRIQKTIYNDVRAVLKKRLQEIIFRLTVTNGWSGDPNRADDPLVGVKPKGRSTVTAEDVVFVLYRMGYPLYGFGSQSKY